ncbi:uncharacterized protein LOC122133067 [Clupea harengus]|uniref:Uncharacterized protein LOC122133067 n=1 Tax=Clupea harengus TaxID=7950 RepID=A0A8M1KNZ9_CLUHA|nr:uncharacterized protein LOC122133067 [Clupea harengus]
MEVQVVSMDRWTYAAVSGMLASLGLCGSLFYIYCLISPRKEHGRSKQPLKLLLGSMVGSNCFLQIILVVHNCKDAFCTPWDFDIAVSAIKNLAAGVNMFSGVWTSMFFYTQIVPARHNFSIWLKRNIKTVVYCALALHCVHVSVHLAMEFSLMYNFMSSTLGSPHTTNRTGFSGNITQCMSVSVSALPMSVELMAVEGVMVAMLWLALALTMASSSATVCYLWGHIKNMEASGSSFSPQLRSQMRVTIAGFVQGLLYLLCSMFVFIMLVFIFTKTIYFDPEERMILTAYSVYSFGTTVNLGVGQTLFRQRVGALAGKVRDWCSTQG